MLTPKFLVRSSLANVVRPVLRQVCRNASRNRENRGFETGLGIEVLRKSDGETGGPNRVSRIYQTVDRYKKWLFKRKPKELIDPPKTDVLSVATVTVEKRAKDLIKKIQDQLDATQRKIEQDVKNTKDTESLRFDDVCKITDCKLRILMGMDVGCGMEKRRVVLTFNDQVHQSFDKLQSDLAPSIERTSVTLNQLLRDADFCVKHARDMILSCGEYANDPEELQKCCDLKKNLALALLDKTEDDVNFVLDDIKSRYQSIMQTHKKAADEVICEHTNKATLLAEDLDASILRIKRRCV